MDCSLGRGSLLFWLRCWSRVICEILLLRDNTGGFPKSSVVVGNDLRKDRRCHLTGWPKHELQFRIFPILPEQLPRRRSVYHRTTPTHSRGQYCH